MGITTKVFGRTAGLPLVTNVLCSFEAGEQAENRVYFAQPVTITGIAGQVVKAVAATDSGTITGANATGVSTSGVLTAAASDAINTVYAAVTPTTNVSVAAGSYYKLTSAKTTAGGKVLVSLQYKLA